MGRTYLFFGSLGLGGHLTQRSPFMTDTCTLSPETQASLRAQAEREARKRPRGESLRQSYMSVLSRRTRTRKGLVSHKKIEDRDAFFPSDE
jgi:hypothetical protein